tara:strand:+ start:146 stop:394 length:249 start_codon:yes stop_codon:yes gene_type:complete
MEIRKERLEEWFSEKSLAFKQKIRDEAVKRAKQTLRKTGRKIDEISPSVYKEMISEEEEDLKRKAMRWGVASIIFGGFMPWW